MAGKFPHSEDFKGFPADAESGSQISFFRGHLDIFLQGGLLLFRLIFFRSSAEEMMGDG